MNNQSIESRKGAQTKNTVTLSQFRGWTHFWAGCIFTIWQGLSQFKGVTECDWKMKLAIALDDTTGLSFAVITFPQTMLYQLVLNWVVIEFLPAHTAGKCGQLHGK